MPFGPRLLQDGRIRFSLWAPNAKQVTLSLQNKGAERLLAMSNEAEGWFSIITDLAAAGSRYQYLIDGKHYVPDPASRHQPDDVHNASEVIDPKAYRWIDTDWRGRPWEETVFYQIHVGTFTPEGSFAGVTSKLDYLADLGVTAIQLMPLAEFAGKHNWGYDVVLPFAPDSRYGAPDDLKDLIASAHGKGMMVFNDVVYNHFGPEGNYLHKYAKAFFNKRHHTPWGNAINFDGKHSQWVRRFFIDNALFWLEEYHFDGLRFDAVQTIMDDSDVDFLHELAEAVRQGPGKHRHIHLVLENDDNCATYLHPQANGVKKYDAQWNDDFHHSLHVLLTGEHYVYYRDYKQRPIRHLARCLTEGFSYQGEISEFRNGKKRGEPSLDLPLDAFVAFLQNHDHIGNRPFAERIAKLCPPEALRAATALLLLQPSPPLLFMGQEWASSSPFNYFVDFPENLGKSVTKGRIGELVKYLPASRTQPELPLPTHERTFQETKLIWDETQQAPHKAWLAFHKELLDIRRRKIIPLITAIKPGSSHFRLFSDKGLSAHWPCSNGSKLTLLANLSSDSITFEKDYQGSILYTTHPNITKHRILPAWCVTFILETI